MYYASDIERVVLASLDGSKRAFKRFKSGRGTPEERRALLQEAKTDARNALSFIEELEQGIYGNKFPYE